MHRILLLFIIGLGAMLLSSVAPWQTRVVKAIESKSVVTEVDLDGLKKLLAPDERNPRPLLVNFWATWCDACREEFPDLVRIQASYKKRGLVMIFVSLDDLTDINTIVPQFLREMRAGQLPNYLLNVPDAEPAIKAVDAAWKGGLPATFLYDKQGNVVFRYMGRIKPLELRAEISKVVK